MNHIYGYARVSTEEQNLDTQIDALEKAGCHRIFAEKITGTATTRPELDNLLKYVRAGDTVIVNRLSRLGRNMRHLLELMELFKNEGITFIALDLGVDSSTPAGKLMLTILAGLAEWQREELLEKTRHGRALAKAAGKSLGRREGLNQERLATVKAALNKKLKVREIVQLTKLPKTTVLRYKAIIEAEIQ